MRAIDHPTTSHSTRLRAMAYFALLGAIFIWGANFIVVKEATGAWKGAEFTYLAARFWVAAIAFYGVLAIARQPVRTMFPPDRRSFMHALVVGVVLAIGYASQTWYLTRGSAINAAFLTSTSVLWAPLIALLMRQRVFAATLIGAGLATLGVILIERPSELLPIHWWSGLALLSAIAFAIEILLVSRFAPQFGTLQWTAAVCVVVAIVMTIIALASETLAHGGADGSPGPWAKRIAVVLFTGVFATAFALALQNWAQSRQIGARKIIDGPRAAILSSLEPVFTLFVGAAAGHLLPGGIGLVGCLAILAGTLVSELAAARRHDAQPETSPATRPAVTP